MTKERKHGTPLQWQEEDSGEMGHPHEEKKIVGQKKVGQEPIEQDQESESLPQLKK